MGSVADKDLSDTGHKICVMGPPKVGKTKLAGELAAYFDRTYWFDLEHGFLTLKQLPLEVQAKINLIEIPDDRSNQLAVRSMDEISKGKRVTICDLHGRVGAVCVDCKKYPDHQGTPQSFSINELTAKDLVVMDTLSQLAVSAMALALKDREDVDAKPEWPEYNFQGLLMDRILTSIQKSKANWVVLSHTVDVEKSEKKTKLAPQAGTRNFSSNAGKYFDHVVYLGIDKNGFTQNSNGLKDITVLTGSRTNVDLVPGVTRGLIDLLRTVKNTEASKVAGNKLQEISKASMPVSEEKEEVDPTLGMNVREKVAYFKLHPKKK